MAGIKRNKWTVPIAEWTKEEHAEHEYFLRLKKIWHQSGAWRRFSLEEFVMGSVKIIEKHTGKKVDSFPSKMGKGVILK